MIKTKQIQIKDRILDLREKNWKQKILCKGDRAKK